MTESKRDLTESTDLPDLIEEEEEVKKSPKKEVKDKFFEEYEDFEVDLGISTA